MSRAQRAGAALLALLLIGGALVVALIISAARGQDRIAAEKSIELVRVALEIRERNTTLSVKDYAWWTEAVRNLVDTPERGVGLRAYRTHQLRLDRHEAGDRDRCGRTPDLHLREGRSGRLRYHEPRRRSACSR